MKLGKSCFSCSDDDLVKGLVNGSRHSVVDFNVISNVSGYHLSC